MIILVEEKKLNHRYIIYLNDTEKNPYYAFWLTKKTSFPFFDVLTSNRVYLSPDVVRPIVFDDKEVSVYYGDGGQWYAQRLE